MLTFMLTNAGPDVESLQYAATKGLDLNATWTANIDAATNVELHDKEGNEESIRVTPLTMALLFGRKEAAEALMQHGARISPFGKLGGHARKHVLRCLFQTGKFNHVLEAAQELVGDDPTGLLKKFNNSFTVAPNSDDVDVESEEEEDDPWDKDDYDNYQVCFFIYMNVNNHVLKIINSSCFL
jgi:hypothetical protein